MLDSQRPPPLPAPTLDSADESNLRDDVDTNVSTRTDKTSYSVPEDGTPITINTTRPPGILHKKYPSQTSLLIEYFEAGKTEGKTRSRPSVRVRVTPSSRKNKSTAGSDHVQITKTSNHPRKPSYTRRISLGSRPREEVIDTRTVEYSDGSNVSSLPPVEIELLPNTSDISSSNGGRFIPMASDVSSMPPDSMLGGKAEILPPGRRRSRSLEREAVTESMISEEQNTLNAPKERRSRSLSKDRITQRVMEKLAQQQAAESASSKSRDASRVSKDELTSPRKSHRRKSKDIEEVSAISGTESSLLSSNADRRSAATRSGVSGTSSINNPKLLATVEDAIKRLILPELNALKEENRTSRNRDKFASVNRDSVATYDTIDSTSSRDHSRRRVSKSSSAPKLHGTKPKVVLNRDGDNPGTILSGGSSHKGERRSSRGSISSYAESTTREEKSSHRRKSKDKSSASTRDAELAGLAGAGLTAAALKHHTSYEEKEEERKHRKHRSSKGSRSRSASISESVDDTYMKAPVPPLPFNHSELIGGSEMTRDSILSAETETKERPESRDSRSSRSTGIETPLHEVARGHISPGPRTPTRTPNALQHALRTAHSNRSTGDARLTSPKSDRSYTSRTRDVTQASLEAAAAAKARAIERSEPRASQFEIERETPIRGVSPIQSEASYREREVVTASPQRIGSIRSGPSVSSLGRRFERQQSQVSIASLESTASTKAARTRKRPQGVTLESKRSILNEPNTPNEAKEFFDQNHETNEMYRRELEESSLASPVNYNRLTSYTDDSAEVQYLDRDEKTDRQDVRKVGSIPEYIHTPLAVESAVASLHDPSSISVRSSAMSSPLKKSRLSQVSPSLEGYLQSEHLQTEEIPSNERWGAIRDKAEALVQQSRAENSPRQSIAKSIEETPQMHHSAFPAGHDDMMPEIGYGMDDGSDVTTNPSIIQGPLGGGDAYHDHADEILSRQEEREQTPTSFNKGAAIAAGAGAAVAAAAAAHHLRDQSPASFDDQHQATVEDDYDQSYPGEPQYEQEGYAQSNRTPLSGPTGWKDEGYQSANQREAYTPQNRNHSKIFDDDGFGDDYDEEGLDGADLFGANGKHGRHASGNSHGMASPLYDSATGKGIDRIQSKDIVALMDHLTVRDAQRNARDTEILVTLVRSAAEMRNQLDELKQFIKTEDYMIMQTTDKRVGLAEQRILNGPRSQPTASPRTNRSSSEDMDMETKKKSIFRRALKGLSSKGDGDIKHIEEMLVQLLGEVEGLKQVQQLSLDQQQDRSNSLTSYENLRASGHSGYEPEGRANTASSPNQSGYLSNPSSSRRIQDLHSGYDVIPTNRISTVNEEDEDEDYDEREPQYENTERMLTPTQEAFQNKHASQQTPPQASRALRDPQSQENTPKRKHKSNSSSVFGIPKISRWSKTTSSTNPESMLRNSGSGERRPYSNHSRSNSQASADEYYDEHDDRYGVRDDGRRRSESSLTRDEGASYRSVRSPSPLIPEEHLQYEMEDPKYQAHRNSLNLQHPQPRAGPTGRHQNHLETQAQIYEPLQSPDYDQWGSMPALARNRLSGGPALQNMSPLSSEGGYSQHSASEQQQAAPPRPLKITDDGPLVPPPQTLAGYGQTRQMYSSPNEFGSQGALTPLAPIAEVRYSLETDRGHRMTPTPSPRPSNQHLHASAAMSNPQRKITGPRPMGSRSPSGQQGLTANSPLQHSDTVIRRKPIQADEESLESYRSSLDSEIF